MGLQDWFPMSPVVGPPLPKWLGVSWPWYKEAAKWYHKTLDKAYRVVAFPRTKEAWQFLYGPYLDANIAAVNEKYHPTWGAPHTELDSLPAEYSITLAISGQEPLTI